MKNMLKKVKNIYQEGCVTVMCNTHRTHPENAADPINLKNLVKIAEERLYTDYDKRFVWPIMEKLNNLVEQIDHNHNLESIVLFANTDFVDYVRLPISVENRVVIDETFATRDLVRAMHQQTAYYVLVLSRQQARLIEAYNDKVVAEKKGAFPFTDAPYTTEKVKLSMAAGQDNLIEEFFNRVDKLVIEEIKNNPMPIVVATETRNFDHYLKMTDRKDLIIGHINKNRDDEAAHQIVSDTWQLVLDYYKKKNSARIAELQKAVSEGKFVSDYSEIWRTIQEGRGQTLFVKQGHFQPALLVDNEIILVEKHEREQKGIVDDIIDEMIEQNLAFGGDVVFMESNELNKFQHLALTTRY